MLCSLVIVLISCTAYYTEILILCVIYKISVSSLQFSVCFFFFFLWKIQYWLFQKIPNQMTDIINRNVFLFLALLSLSQKQPYWEHIRKKKNTLKFLLLIVVVNYFLQYKLKVKESHLSQYFTFSLSFLNYCDTVIIDKSKKLNQTIEIDNIIVYSLYIILITRF